MQRINIPEAKRENMVRLLELLSSPCINYKGNRADDLINAIDIESEWAWRYAGTMLRGLEERKLEYGEGHHIVPVSWYRINGYRGGTRTLYVCENNLTSLSFGEHLYAHYCLKKCATGKFKQKMCSALYTMVNVKGTGFHKIYKTDDDFINAIPEIEIEKARVMMPGSSIVEEEGRTHYWQDPQKAWKDSHDRWKENLSDDKKADIKKRRASWSRENRKLNHDKVLERERNYNAKNPGRSARNARIRRARDPEKAREKERAKRAANPDKIRTRERNRYHSHPEKMQEQARARRAANPDKFRERDRARYEKDPTKKRESAKRYRLKKIAAGFRRVKDPVTGSHNWVKVAATLC